MELREGASRPGSRVKPGPSAASQLLAPAPFAPRTASPQTAGEDDTDCSLLWGLLPGKRTGASSSLRAPCRPPAARPSSRPLAPLQGEGASARAPGRRASPRGGAGPGSKARLRGAQV